MCKYIYMEIYIYIFPFIFILDIGKSGCHEEPEKELFYLLIPSLNNFNPEDRARLGPGSRNFFSVSQVAGTDSGIWVIVCCFIWHISGELNL